MEVIEISAATGSYINDAILDFITRAKIQSKYGDEEDIYFMMFNGYKFEINNEFLKWDCEENKNKVIKYLSAEYRKYIDSLNNGVKIYENNRD